MSLWLPKWLRQDVAPEPEDVRRRYFIFAGAAAAAAALLPAPALDGWGEKLFAFDPASPDQYVAYYRARMLHGVVCIDRQTLLQGVNQPGVFLAAVRKETTRALAEVAAQAKAGGYRLVEPDPEQYAQRVVNRLLGYREHPERIEGREVVVPIAVHEQPHWCDEDGRVLTKIDHVARRKALAQTRPENRFLVRLPNDGGDDAT